MNGQYKRKKLFLLGPYAALINWVFQFIILTALPVLAAGAVFSAVDLLTGGLLSHASPIFNIVWSVGQAAAIELLFFSAFMKVAEAVHHGQWGRVIGWLIVGLILALPTAQAALVYGMVHTFNISVPQAITQIGLSDMEWLITRTAAVLFVGALEGFSAYSDEGTEKSVEEQIAEMEAKTALSKASARMNAARASAWLKAGKSAAQAAFSNEDEEGSAEEDNEGNNDPNLEPPTGDSENVVSIQGKGKRRKGKKTVPEAVTRDRIFKLLEQHPNMASNEIMKRTHCSLSTVSKYKNLYREMHPEQYVRSKKRA